MKIFFISEGRLLLSGLTCRKWGIFHFILTSKKAEQTENQQLIVDLSEKRAHRENGCPQLERDRWI